MSGAYEKMMAEKIAEVAAKRRLEDASKTAGLLRDNPFLGRFTGKSPVLEDYYAEAHPTQDTVGPTFNGAQSPPRNYLAALRTAIHGYAQQGSMKFFTEHEEHMAETFALIARPINDWMRLQGFWESRNVGEKLMLIVTEVAEACEAHRKGDITGDDGLANELADTVIRVLDLAGELELDLGRAIARKMRKNLHRPRKHGKAY